MIEIINLGLNNLNSVVTALEACTKTEIKIIENAAESRFPQLIVLPGTGSFGAAAKKLDEEGFGQLLAQMAAEKHGYIVGVCLGMQLFSEHSEESPGAKGLGILPGAVRKLEEFPGPLGRVPHVGWATLVRDNQHTFEGIPPDKLRDVYFSHSYHLELAQDDAETLRVEDGQRSFIAAVRFTNLTGYQFHPEKSSECGLGFIAEMLRWSGIEN